MDANHSAWLLGMVGVLQFLPVIVFSLFGGVLAEWVSKRTLLLVAQSVALVQAAILWILVVTGTVHIWHIMVLAALLGMTQAGTSSTQETRQDRDPGRTTHAS